MGITVYKIVIFRGISSDIQPGKFYIDSLGDL